MTALPPREMVPPDPVTWEDIDEAYEALAQEKIPELAARMVEDGYRPCGAHSPVLAKHTRLSLEFYERTKLRRLFLVNASHLVHLCCDGYGLIPSRDEFAAMRDEAGAEE